MKKERISSVSFDINMQKSSSKITGGYRPKGKVDPCTS